MTILTFDKGDQIANKYTVQRLIDTGGFADVWEAKTSDDEAVAIKIYPRLDTEGVKIMEEEWEKQKDLENSHLVIATEYNLHNGYPYLAMPYCAGGNAFNKIGECDELEIAKCISQVGDALGYLHKMDMVHQDLKPNNILLHDGNYFLADLGLSLKVRNTIQKFTNTKGNSKTNSIAGTTPPAYRAPELYDRSIIGKDPVKATDIWAFGATLYELMTGEVPLGEFGGMLQLKDKGDDLSDLPDNYSEDLNTIIRKCLSKNTWDRPKASDLVEWANNYKAYGYWLPKKPIPVPLPTPPANNLLKWAAGVVLMAGLGFGGYKLVSKSKLADDGKGGNVVTLVPPKPEPTPPVKPVLQKPNPDPEVVVTSNPLGPVVDSDPKPTKEQWEKIKTIRNPSVESSPKNSSIDITSLKREETELIVHFRLKKGENASNESSFAIYDTKDPHYAFYIGHQGNKYRLTNMQNGTGGESVKWGTDTYRDFTATFDISNLPNNITRVDILEAIERTPGQSYWNFKGVQIPKFIPFNEFKK